MTHRRLRSNVFTHQIPTHSTLYWKTSQVGGLISSIGRKPHGIFESQIKRQGSLDSTIESIYIPANCLVDSHGYIFCSTCVYLILLQRETMSESILYTVMQFSVGRDYHACIFGRYKKRQLNDMKWKRTMFFEKAQRCGLSNACFHLVVKCHRERSWTYKNIWTGSGEPSQWWPGNDSSFSVSFMHKPL